MNFGQAFECVKNGGAMRLLQWSVDVSVKAQYPGANSKMTAPYLYVESRFGRVPWKETNIELFSEDWEVVYADKNGPDNEDEDEDEDEDVQVKAFDGKLEYYGLTIRGDEDSSEDQVAQAMRIEDAKRIVLCWNYCFGLTTKQLACGL